MSTLSFVTYSLTEQWSPNAIACSQLRIKCAQRDVNSKGTKAELCQRLITWDELNAEDMEEQVTSTFTFSRRMSLLVSDHVHRLIDPTLEVPEMIYTHCDTQAVDPASKERGTN